MALSEQMELFDDGGLKDEGGTVDPVSGNDVPPGSTQEEVRDDIPAQLSEGEFVFPADVVRYIGLEKLMKMRQEAKMGLKMMEDMGQMGNSDEATIPDDIPFAVTDLVIVDKDDDMEYNVGGFVPAAPQQQQQFGIAGYTPAATPTTGFTQTMAPFQYGQQQPQQFMQQTTPVAQAPIPTTQENQVPEFSEFVGGGFGEYDELREYRNESGQVLMIPFKDGSPISPIPEGYTFYDPEQTATEEATTESTLTDAQLRNMRELATDQQDRDDTSGFASSDVTGIGYDKNKLTKELRDVVNEFGAGFGTLGETFNVGAGIARELSKDPRVKSSSITSGSLGGVLDAFRGNADPNKPVTFTDPSRMGSKKNQYKDTTPLHEMSSSKQIEIATVARTVVESIRTMFVDADGRALRASVVDKNLAKAAKDLGISLSVDSLKGPVKKSRTGLAREIARARTLKIIEDRKAAEAAEARARNIAFGERMSRKAEAERAAKAAQEGTFERALQEAQEFKVGTDERQDAFGRYDEDSGGFTPESVIARAIEEAESMVESGYYDENKGGLMSNEQLMKDAVKKSTKKKKMKRGGLASKK